MADISLLRKDNFALAFKLGELLKEQGRTLTLAESCTGGGVSECVTAINGSSAWFDRAFITYSNQSKIDMLGVLPATLATHGAVSENTALEMAMGAIHHAQANISASITGIAGPTGGSIEKPIGMICFGFSIKDLTDDFHSRTHTAYFTGDREQIRLQAICMALSGLINLLNSLTITG